jgi:septum formation protein
MPRLPLVLASGSTARRALMCRLKVPFEVDPAEIDESPLAGEEPVATALRLARLKAEAVGPRWPGHLIIGSDQVAVTDGVRLEKPGSHLRAEAQLALMQGKTARFHTGLAVRDASSGAEWTAVEFYEVRLRPLSQLEIERYVALEEPLSSAGSFLAEGLGSVLFERLEGSDPTTLLGLPLIRLNALLAKAGYDLIDQAWQCRSGLSTA